MAHTINLDDDFIGAEELELMKTKQAILEKLRVRFGEVPNRAIWGAARVPETERPAKSGGVRPG